LSNNNDKHFNKLHHSYSVTQVDNMKGPDVSTAVAIVVVIVNFINSTRKSVQIHFP